MELHSTPLLRSAGPRPRRPLAHRRSAPRVAAAPGSDLDAGGDAGDDGGAPAVRGERVFFSFLFRCFGHLRSAKSSRAMGGRAKGRAKGAGSLGGTSCSIYRHQMARWPHLLRHGLASHQAIGCSSPGRWRGCRWWLEFGAFFTLFSHWFVASGHECV